MKKYITSTTMPFFLVVFFLCFAGLFIFFCALFNDDNFDKKEVLSDVSVHFYCFINVWFTALLIYIIFYQNG